jgi:hypothetical protein
MRSLLGSAICVALVSFCVSCVHVQKLGPERTVDGLSRVPSKRVDRVYTAPGVTLAPYRRVMLDPIDVAFKRDWERQHPEVSPAELARIRSEAAELFQKIFARELADKGGYALADQPAPDVLRVRASIVDLDIAAPDVPTASTVRRYVVSPGEMTLLAELRDSQSGAILVRAADREKGRQFGNLQIANSVTNSAEAQRAFAMWAGLLRDALDAAKEAPAETK